MAHIDPMTEREAQECAPQWGSFIRNSDPGYIMYTAIPPEQAAHRDEMVAFIKSHCMAAAQRNVDAGDFLDGPEELARLVAYLDGLTYPAPETKE